MKLETIYGQPWQIRPDVWQRFHQDYLAFSKRGVDGAMGTAKEAVGKRPATNRFGDEFAKFEMVGKVAVVPISGALVKGATGSEKYFDEVSSHEDIHADIDAGLAARAEAFVFHVNSPGGTVCGTPELADRIAHLPHEGKRTAMFTSDLCCSAAIYAVASCGALFTSPSAFVGSIGTIWDTINIAGMLEELGVEWNVFTSGPLKGTGHPAKRLSEEQAAWMQGVVDKMSVEFKSHVTKHRKAVGGEAMQGQTFTGSEACANGLFDATAGSLQEVIEMVR